MATTFTRRLALVDTMTLFEQSKPLVRHDLSPPMNKGS
jgi:hypothetical protein